MFIFPIVIGEKKIKEKRMMHRRGFEPLRAEPMRRPSSYEEALAA